MPGVKSTRLTRPATARSSSAKPSPSRAKAGPTLHRQLGGNGITINAVSGNVAIHGVSLNGAGITGGTNGIVFNSGDSLTVTDCVAQNFILNGFSPPTGNGILIQPSAGTVTFVITNTVVSHNGLEGISYFALSGADKGNGIIDHVVVSNNVDGISIVTNFGSGHAVAISNTIASNNTHNGIFVTGDIALQVSIDNTNVGGSLEAGIEVDTNTSTVTLGRSVITANTNGLATTGVSHVFSFQDNRISGNGMDIVGQLNSIALR